MDRDSGRRRLAVLTAAVGAGAAAVAALVGATRPAPHHATPTVSPASDQTLPGDAGRHRRGGSGAPGPSGGQGDATSSGS